MSRDALCYFKTATKEDLTPIDMEVQSMMREKNIALYYKGGWTSFTAYLGEMAHADYAAWLEWVYPQLSVLGIEEKKITIFVGGGSKIRVDIDSAGFWLNLKELTSSAESAGVE